MRHEERQPRRHEGTKKKTSSSSLRVFVFAFLAQKTERHQGERLATAERRQRAAHQYAWPVVAEQTLDLFRSALLHRLGAVGRFATASQEVRV